MTAVAEPVVRLDDVVARFGAQTVLDGTSLSVATGALTAVIGRSGCGKTTLLRLIAGLIGPAAGTVHRRFTEAAFVFQDHRLLPWRSAVDNVAIGMMAKVASARERRSRARRVLATCGFDGPDLAKYPGQLSGGMKARVAIARALAIDPQLVLLDEPFNGLDFARRLAMQDMVRRLVEERAVTAIFVTHDLAEAARIADRILVMAPSGGRIVDTLAIAPGAQDRDAAFIRAEVARLLARPAVAACIEGRSCPESDVRKITEARPMRTSDSQGYS